MQLDELRHAGGEEPQQTSIEERARLVSDELSRQEEDQEGKVKVLSE